jgi:hypothetical protein
MSAATTAAGALLPGLLMALLPSLPPARAAVLQGRRALDLSCAPAAAAALKGSLAIVMRSITTQADGKSNFCAPAAQPGGAAPGAWLHQTARLCALCAAALAAAGQQDALLDAACVRTLELCTDSGLWRCHAGGEAAAAAASQAVLLQLLSRQPGAFFAAVRRLAAQRSPLLPRLVALCLRLAAGSGPGEPGAAAQEEEGAWRGLALQVRPPPPPPPCA